MTDAIRLGSVALDCPDAGQLAAFYAEITSGRIVYRDPAWATVDGLGGRIDFQTVAGYLPPRWPDPTSSIQMHLDLVVDDLAAAGARVLAAGATRFAFQPNADHCIVYADPAGHPFCLTTWDEIGATSGTKPPITEIDRLVASLDTQRRHVLGALEGLDGRDVRRPVLPSGWTCLGMVQHLTSDIERFWFGCVVAGKPDTSDDPAWRVEPQRGPAAVLDAYRAEIERANVVLRASDLDSPPAWWPPDQFGTWRLGDVREIVLHVITETACHAGHLDVARELIDGRQWSVVTE